MPRRSLARAEATPTRITRQKRHATGTSSPPPMAKRRKMNDEPPAEDLQVSHMDPEAELEAWQEFVADHYEMVEQLPLELHRNFRLLRELDDGSATQTDRLQSLIRNYIQYRLGTTNSKHQLNDGIAANGSREATGPGARQTTEPLSDAALLEDAEKSEPKEDGSSPQDEDEDADGEYEVDDEVSPNDNAVQSQDPPTPSQSEPIEAHDDTLQQIPSPRADDTTHQALAPVSDGQGGLVVPPDPLEPVQRPVERLAFPDTAGAGAPHSNTSGTAVSEAGSKLPAQRRKENDNLLPEIGRLAREIVRNGEEKLAVAIGAYNSIDRHIRALDSALSAQEASILLGLRPDTNPSAAIDGTINGPGDPSAIVEENGEVVIGMGGGRKRDKKGKKARPVPVAEDGSQDHFGIVIPPEFEIDPNEPKYCYCNQVSFGEMLGCENDECPLEWFHLPCTGLSAIPTGKWYCNVCRPKPGLGQATTSGSARKKSHRKR